MVWAGARFVQFNDAATALPHYFDVYARRMKVGFVSVMTGGTGLKIGCGKTMSSVKLAEMCDKHFSADDFATTPREFLEIIQRIENEGKAGRWAILDEGEIAVASNAWYSLNNECISHTLATFRNLRAHAIVITPSFAWIDRRIRTLCAHWMYPVMSLRGSEEMNKVVDLYINQIKTDLFGDKIIFRKIRLYDNINKRPVTLRRIRMSLPSEALRDAVDKKVDDFKHNTREDLLKRLIAQDKETVVNTQARGEKFEEILKGVMAHPYIVEQLKEKGRVSSSDIRCANPNLAKNNTNDIAKAINVKWSGKANG